MQVNFTWIINFKALIVLPENVRELFVGADEFFYLEPINQFFVWVFEETRLWRFERCHAASDAGMAC